jgi:hypothetical protein
LTDPEFTTSLGRLFVNDIKATAPTMGAPWLDVFDEFHAFAGEQAVDLANMGRSFGVCGVFSTISFADLERGVPQGGPAFAAQFISSVNSFIFHQVNAPTDAETAARIIGTVPELELTAQMLGESASGAASARTVREFQQHPDNVKNAEIGEAIFVNKNRHTVVRMKMLLSELSRQS